MTRLRKRFMDCKGLTQEQAESYAHGLAEQQRDVLWQLGDLAKYCEARWPDTHYQVWPEWISPGLLARVAAVAKAYPQENGRVTEATWTQYMREANQPDRQERVQSHVDAGRTSDEARVASANQSRSRWLLAFDIHYFAHRHYYSGAGVETAMQVSEWVRRTVERLKEKGATDVVCAFEGHGSFRKELTADPKWTGSAYKDRPPKPSDLTHQLQLVRELLEKAGFACVSIDGYEADDVLASYANQFEGKTTIISSDKDLRQCLGTATNILLDVEWTEDDTSGDMLPEYKWLTAHSHTESTGIPPDQWADYQCLMGDNVDGIQGAAGVGEKGAKDLILEFGNVESLIDAARADDERIKPKRRATLLEFEHHLDVTRKLVRLVKDLPVPMNTRI
jgi:5'-3' exonuclease